MQMSSDSEFEEISIGDVMGESKGDGNQVWQQEEPSLPRSVQVVLPETFNPLPPPAGQKQDDTSSKSDVSSMASSYVPVSMMGSLGIHRTCHIEKQEPSPKEENSQGAKSGKDGWSLVDDNSAVPPVSSQWSSSSANTLASKATAGSMISGFDYLSINGSSMRRCKKCSCLSPGESSLCIGCGVALISNPCTDWDEQIARHLQDIEEQAALELIRCEEKKRKTLTQQPIFVRSQALASDVVTRVQRLGGHGFVALAQADLTLLASRFIETVESTMKKGNSTVSVGCTYTTKDCGMMDLVRNNGFGQPVDVSFSLPNGRTNAASSLRPIFENQCLPMATVFLQKTDRLGWVVAVVRENIDENQTVLSSDPERCLPLVTFDESLFTAKQAVMHELIKSMAQVVLDFFCTDWDLVKLDPETHSPASIGQDTHVSPKAAVHAGKERAASRPESDLLAMSCLPHSTTSTLSLPQVNGTTTGQDEDDLFFQDVLANLADDAALKDDSDFSK